MPPRHGTGPYANWRHDISYQKRSEVAACESTSRIARVLFPHGLASAAQLRPASCMASWCDAINGRGSCRVKGLRRTIQRACATLRRIEPWGARARQQGLLAKHTFVSKEQELVGEREFEPPTPWSRPGALPISFPVNVPIPS
jgi:hypothetical protein